LGLIARSGRIAAPAGSANDVGSSVLAITAGPRPPCTSAHALAAAGDIPVEYLRKILHRLAKARLIVSERGRRGGFLLSRPAEQISLLDITQAIDGPLDDTALLADEVLAPAAPAAVDALRAWRVAAARDLRATLAARSLATLLADDPCGAVPAHTDRAPAIAA
jgi:Rrf2 family protein